MKALRLIGFGALLALFILFAYNNWVAVPVELPNGSKAEVLLPVVVLVAILLGWLPMLVIHLASRASWRRRTTKVERLLDDALTAGPRVAAPVTPPGGSFTPLP